MKVNENIVLCCYSVQFLLILENFCINRKLNLKKVSFYKPPPTPFRPCPAKQQGKILSFQLRGKTNRQMLCIKGGQKGDKNWWKHVRARYLFCCVNLPRKVKFRFNNRDRLYPALIIISTTDFGEWLLITNSQQQLDIESPGMTTIFFENQIT